MPSDVILNSRYHLSFELGRGASCVTWLAHLKKSTRLKLVIKELLLEQLDNWQSLEQFEQEAKILSHLEHPNIPDFVDFLEEETPAGKRLYLVQEWIDGDDLAGLIESGKRFTEDDAVHIARTICEILIYLHGFSPPIIHRDIKPGNIMLRQSDQKVYLIDFGAVKGPVQANQGLTMTGTVGFMPLEQIEGQAVPASDLYALGMSLIQILSLQEPAQLPKKDLKPDFRPFVNISKPFASLIDQLVEADVAKRFQSAHDVLDALERLQQTADEEPQQDLDQGSEPAAETQKQHEPESVAQTIDSGAAQAEVDTRSSEDLSLQKPALQASTIRDTSKKYKPSESRVKEQVASNPFAKALPADTTSSFAASLQKSWKALLACFLGIVLLGWCSLQEQIRELKQTKTAETPVAVPSQLPLMTSETYLGQANAYYKADQCTLAIPYYNEALKIINTDAEAYFKRAYCYGQQKDYQLAIADYLAALKLNPMVFAETTHHNLGYDYYKLNQFKEAIPHFKKQLELRPQHLSSLNYLGLIYHELQQDQLALNFYQKAIEIDPQYRYPYANRGRVFHDQGKYDLALKDYQKALAVAPKYSLAHYYLAELYYDQAKYSECLLSADQAIQYTDHYASAHNIKGLCYYRQQKFESADKAFRQALLESPNYASAWYNIGLVYEAQNKLHDAEQAYLAAIKQDPDHHQSYNNLGYIYERQGRLEDAFTHYSKAIERNPRGLYYSNRAHIEYLLEMCLSAQQDWARACELGDTTACETRKSKACIS